MLRWGYLVAHTHARGNQTRTSQARTPVTLKSSFAREPGIRAYMQPPCWDVLSTDVESNLNCLSHLIKEFRGFRFIFIITLVSASRNIEVYYCKKSVNRYYCHLALTKHFILPFYLFMEYERCQHNG